jgi:hypothetical protein
MTRSRLIAHRDARTRRSSSPSGQNAGAPRKPVKIIFNDGDFFSAAVRDGAARLRHARDDAARP